MNAKFMSCKKHFSYLALRMNYCFGNCIFCFIFFKAFFVNDLNILNSNNGRFSRNRQWCQSYFIIIIILFNMKIAEPNLKTTLKNIKICKKVKIKKILFF